MTISRNAINNGWIEVLTLHNFFLYNNLFHSDWNSMEEKMSLPFDCDFNYKLFI